MKENTNQKFTELKTIPGIDALYYFCETNARYSEFYKTTKQALEEKQKFLEISGVDIYTIELSVTIEDIPFTFLGRGKGFLWFIDANGFYKIGFKDPETNTNLHNIQVQLLSNGIYAMGIKELIPHIDAAFETYLTGHKPVTRADLNSFVQLDLSFVNETMFASRKRDMEIRKKLHSNTMQTIYVGKRPFLLRIYNKKAELENTHKEKLMKLYFEENGFDYTESIFNVEFELHRQYLRTYKIDTVDDLLQKAVQLFGKCIDAIRLIDVSTLSATNRYRAQTHPIWEAIRQDYTLEHFDQSDTLLERIKRKKYVYQIDEFEKEFKGITKRAYLSSLPVTVELLRFLFEEMKHEVDKNRSSR